MLYIHGGAYSNDSVTDPLNDGQRLAARGDVVMQESFVAFAVRGDPNHAGLETWRPYDLTTRATMLFDSRLRIENDPRKWQRELFARIPYIQPGT